MNIKALLVENLLEGGLMVFGLGFLYAFLSFPNLPEKFQDIQAYLRLGCLVGAMISFPLGAVLWIQNFKRWKIPHKYRPPSALQGNFVFNMKCNVLYAGVASVYSYSAYADWIKNKSNPSKIFTVCAFEPCEILNYFLPRYNERLRSDGKQDAKLDNLERLSNEEFRNQVDIDFPHFKNFQDFFKEGKKKGKYVERILLLRDESALDRNKKWMFEKFKVLNGDVPCYVAFRNILEKIGIAFLTDFVVYDDKFIIDYYSDSNTFVLSYLGKKDSLVRNQLLALITHYQKNQTNPNIYKPLEELIKGL